MRFHAPIVILLLSVISTGLQAQQYHLATEVEVLKGGKTLTNPWAGGMSCPQFSAIDIDKDGFKDLFVFDRHNDRPTTYLNKLINGTRQYVYAPSYETDIPYITGLGLLVDYNCDGKEDLFANSEIFSGLAVYKNLSTNPQHLDFKMVNEGILTKLPGFPPSNLYVSRADIPAIADFDGDGDLDIAAADNFGLQVFYYRNRSKETQSNCDTLLFDGAPCWGHFLGDQATGLWTLDAACKGGMGNPTTNDGAHGATTLLAYDKDNDGDKEILLGDMYSNRLQLFNNAGTIADARIDTIIENFPDATNPAMMYSFPGGFMLDVDNDGIKDLIAAPNTPQGSENVQSAWFYKNVGTNAIPDFKFVKKDFLQETMIDVGGVARPSLVDYDGDGLQDLVIASWGGFTSITSSKKTLTVYKNVGAKGAPKFEYITSDFDSLSYYELKSMQPSFGDLDNDGDLDMLVGIEDGTIVYFKNKAGQGNTLAFDLPQINYQNINVFKYASPQIVDVNNDGLLDLIVGSTDGDLNYFQNTGTASNPVFNLTQASWGGVDVRKKTYARGISVPFLFKKNGKSKLIVGSEFGFIYAYDNIDGNLTGTFTLTDTLFTGSQRAMQITVGGGSLGSVGAVDLVVGNSTGGVSLYSTEFLSTEVLLQGAQISAAVFPNPAGDSFSLQVDAGFAINKWTYTITDVSGRIVAKGNVQGSKSEQVQSSGWSKGLYFCTVQTDKGSKSLRIAIQ